MSTGVPLGRAFGVRVIVEPSALIVGVLFGVQLAARFGPAVASTVVLAFGVSIVAHEIGHAIAARQFGIGTDVVRLWALGGVAELDREPPTPRAQGWIAVSGPLVSLALGVACWWIALAIHDPGFRNWIAAISMVGFLNLFIGVFNLLPGSPLDGGRLLYAFRWRTHGDRHRATREAARAGLLLAVTIGVLGIAAGLRAGGGLWLIITAIFLWVSARLELASADTHEALDGLTVGDVTWFGVAEAGPDMDADSLLWQRKRLGSAGAVSVTDERGQAIGLVLERDLWEIPAQQRPWVMLTQLLIPFDHTVRATPTETLSAAVGRSRHATAPITVWDGGRLVGLVPPRALQTRLDRHTDR